MLKIKNVVALHTRQCREFWDENLLSHSVFMLFVSLQTSRREKFCCNIQVL